ncbi:MAG: sigma-54-dependent transcriptional regulator, partial [Vicinamibacterales bacterium]
PRTAGHGQERPSVVYVFSGRISRQTGHERIGHSGVHVSSATEPNYAVKLLNAQPGALALVDLTDGRVALATIRAIAARCPGASVIALADAANPVLTAEAVQAGAGDLLTWPFEDRDLLMVIADARDRRASDVSGAGASEPGEDQIVAQSAVMKTLVERLEPASRARGVLVAGEPGSGRGHLARVLHARRVKLAGTPPAKAASPSPFVVEDCAAGGSADLEERLFGVVSANGHDGKNGKAAFERVARAGAIHQARGGTLCLLNVPEAPVRVQARLARILRDREAELADQPGTLIDLDLHVVVCAGLDVDEAIADGRLRSELYDRIAQARIDIPPLRRRREDIPVLAVRLIAQAGAGEKGSRKSISRSALKLLAALPWRGNVTELKSLAALLVRGTDRPVIELDDVLEHANLEGAAVRVDLGLSLREAKARFERECIAAVLARHQGRVSDAARALGIQRTNLYRKVRELQVARPIPSTRGGR